MADLSKKEFITGTLFGMLIGAATAFFSRTDIRRKIKQKIEKEIEGFSSPHPAPSHAVRLARKKDKRKKVLADTPSQKE